LEYLCWLHLSNSFVKAFSDWGFYDNRLDELIILAKELNQFILESSRTDKDDQFDLMMQIHYLDASLTDDTNTMMMELNDASQQLKTIILRIIPVFTVLILLYAWYIIASFMNILLLDSPKKLLISYRKILIEGVTFGNNYLYHTIIRSDMTTVT